MKAIAGSLLCLLFSCALLSAVPVASAAEGDQRAVLVTGASSGIGRKIAERLAVEGHFVYAGARKAEDIAALSALDNVMGIRLDVTIQDEIDAAVELIRNEGRGLWGIINNAGVIVMGPMLEGEVEDLEFQFDVNVYGPYRINRAFADLILESGGRFSTISSISGVLSSPGYGAYSMSKHAVEAYSDALAAEMQFLDNGVHVSAIEPGSYKSQILESMCERMRTTGQLERETRWEAAQQRGMAICGPDFTYDAPEPDAVADAALHAMFDPNPKGHYMVVPGQRAAEVTIRKAIEELVALNHDQPFSYSREQLVEMLDAELAAIEGGE